jgi:hypothetical protein
MASGVGFNHVANFANTYPGTALGVVANAYNGYGDAVGDGEVIILGDTAPTAYFILMENAGYVLQENDDKIQLES